MKITLRKARLAAAALVQIENKAFPAKMGYAFSVNKELLDREMEHLDKERIKICENYAEKDEEGKAKTRKGSYVMSAEDNEKCNKEFSELLDTEIELNIRTIPMELAERCEVINKYDALTAGEFRALSFMFTE